MRLLALALLLSACSFAPSTSRSDAWNDPESGECGQLDDNGGGMWAEELCRDGNGVLVWAVWIF